MLSKTHAPQGDMLIRDIIARIHLRVGEALLKRLKLAGRHPLFPNLIPELPGLYAQVGEAVVALPTSTPADRSNRVRAARIAAASDPHSTENPAAMRSEGSSW
jgi:hypothetical protein